MYTVVPGRYAPSIIYFCTGSAVPLVAGSLTFECMIFRQ